MATVGAVAIGGFVFWFLSKKKRAPVTLEDPDKKYALPLIEKEVM